MFQKLVIPTLGSDNNCLVVRFIICMIRKSWTTAKTPLFESTVDVRCLEFDLFRLVFTTGTEALLCG